MMHLGGHSAPRHKNVIFVQVLSTKKIMLAMLKVFNILQIFSYSEQTYNENFFLSLPPNIFKTKQPILRFWELSGFVHFLGL